KSYVREDDASVILKMAGGLCVLMFCLEWLVLTLAFFLRYDYAAFAEGGPRGSIASMNRKCAKVQDNEEDMKNWPWPFQV
ncbi:hypothetical protein Tco_0960980, partial [Tanacetum coccineum]